MRRARPSAPARRPRWRARSRRSRAWRPRAAGPTAPRAPARPSACARAAPTRPACAAPLLRSVRRLLGARALLLAADDALDELEDLRRPARLRVPVDERRAPRAHGALGRELVEVGARDLEPDARIGGDLLGHRRARHFDAVDLGIAAAAELQADDELELLERGNLVLKAANRGLDQRLGVPGSHAGSMLARRVSGGWPRPRCQQR